MGKETCKELYEKETQRLECKFADTRHNERFETNGTEQVPRWFHDLMTLQKVKIYYVIS
jgi:hypothetical protein